METLMNQGASPPTAKTLVQKPTQKLDPAHDHWNDLESRSLPPWKRTSEETPVSAGDCLVKLPGAEDPEKPYHLSGWLAMQMYCVTNCPLLLSTL